MTGMSRNSRKDGAGMSNPKAIVLYLHVHQPYRVRHYSIFDAGTSHDYFDAVMKPRKQRTHPPKSRREIIPADQRPAAQTPERTS
jgi:hypothetical protein